MRQFAEDVALPAEPLDELLTVRSGVGKFERQRTLDGPVAAACAPDRSHTTAADFLLDDIRPYDSAGRESRSTRSTCAGQVEHSRVDAEEVKLLGRGVLFEQLAQQ